VVHQLLILAAVAAAFTSIQQVLAEQVAQAVAVTLELLAQVRMLLAQVLMAQLI
jgi:hypothetical protein